MKSRKYNLPDKNSKFELSDNILEFPIEHIVQEVICIHCKKRHIDVRPKSLWLKDCVCPKCHKKGFLIATGQEIDEEDL